MNDNLHLLDTLKDKLINSNDFSAVMHYFFDHFAENHAFMQLGKAQHSSFVETIVTETASAALGERVVVRGLRLIRLVPQKFYHGPCFVNGRIATLFYFEDIRTGMLAIAMSDSSGEMRYARITAVAIIEPKTAKWN